MMIGNLAIVKDCNNKEVYFLAHRAARPAASHTMSSTLTLLDWCRRQQYKCDNTQHIICISN